MKTKISILSELFTAFFKIGSVSFGGGYAMLPLLDKELAEKRKWVSPEELLDYYAIGQSTPGIIAINTATFVGYKCAGVGGAVSATLGMIFPSLIIIILIAFALERGEENPYVQKAMKGINIAVAVLLLSSVWKFAQKTIKGLLTASIGLLAFLGIIVLDVPPVLIVLASGAIGFVLNIFKPDPRKKV